MADAAEELLQFWFGTLSQGFSDQQHRSRWFGGGSEFDDVCRVHFAGLVIAAADGDLNDWLEQPRSRLAFILLCDQLPRNLYRGEALAFATDGPALNAARTGVEAGLDQALDFDERCFFYLPFEHSESLVDQHTCVGLLTDLRDSTPDGYRHHTGDYLRYAHQHRDIIRKFGRFPHRNATLGRESTGEELVYLQDGHDFGQSSN